MDYSKYFLSLSLLHCLHGLFHTGSDLLLFHHRALFCSYNVYNGRNFLSKILQLQTRVSLICPVLPTWNIYPEYFLTISSSQNDDNLFCFKAFWGDFIQFVFLYFVIDVIFDCALNACTGKLANMFYFCQSNEMLYIYMYINWPAKHFWTKSEETLKMETNLPDPIFLATVQFLSQLIY